MSDPRRQQNFQFLAADDQLYVRLQQKFKQQYLKRQEQLEIQYQQVKSLRAQAQRQKQDVGVRLYNAQQQLASNQMDYQRAHDNFNIAQRLRAQAEQKLSQVNQLYGAKKQQSAVLKNKVSKAQKQLQNLMRHYHQIEAYNIQLKSDIAVTKKETFTAQDGVANLQNLKKKQDLLIDSMNQQSKRLQEQKNVLTAQIISQKEETQQAKKLLRQAQAQMQKVQASKRGLLQRWQKSIAQMQKRDSAVQTVAQRLSAQKQNYALLLNQLAGIKTQIKRQEELTQRLGAQSTLIAKQRDALMLALKELQEEDQRVGAQLLSLKESLGHTQLNIKTTSNEQKAVEDEMTQVENSIMKLHAQTKRLQDALVDQKSEHTTIQKTAANLVKQGRQIGLDIAQKQMQLQGILNQVARIKIDQLNTKSQIELLQKKREQQLAQQNQKKYKVIIYEVQIKQGHDINQKKQHQVGRLNKLHDQLMSKANDQGKNPQQNKLINLTRQTQDMIKDCNQMYRQWIKKQTLLVQQNNKLNELDENVSQLVNKKTIMQQKKKRLNDSYRNFQKEIEEIRISLKGLQQEMNKLNDGIAVNAQKKRKLQNDNVNLQSQFVQKLKEMEHDATKLEYNIDLIREEKAELMNQIVQCQRQILLWQRKYQLEKEMQEVVDPNVGQTEIQELKKQLHRMELRHSSLIKQQTKILAQAQRAIDKREVIQVKSQAMKAPVKNVKSPQNTNQLKHAMRNAKENQAKIMKSLQDTQKMLSKRQGELDSIAQNIEDVSAQLRRLENQNLSLDGERVLGRLRRSMNVLMVAALQKKYKKMAEIADKTAKLSYSQPILREKLGDVKERNRALFEAIEGMAQKYMQYGELLTPLLDTNRVSSNLMGP